MALCFGVWSYVLVFGCFVVQQKTAYELRISDWSSDVCSSDLSTSRGSTCSTPSSSVPSPCASASREQPPRPRRDLTDLVGEQSPFDRGDERSEEHTSEPSH